MNPLLKRLVGRINRYWEDLELKRLSSLPRYVEAETKMLGSKLRLPDSVSFLSAKREIFGNEIYRFKSTSDAPYILDCGANIGLSIIYFKRLFPLAEIVAFEPDPRIFQFLQENVLSFDLTKVTLINKAIWNRETVLSFHNEGSDAGRITT